MEHVKVHLLDDNAHVQYGLNWGQRENREPNQAYLQLEPEVYKGNFFPEKGKYFIAETDDKNTLFLNRAQKEYGCALQTPESNSILGTYIRNRLNILLGAEITKDSILNYGRLDIDFYKIDNQHYMLDFSKDWKTQDVEYLFKVFLITQRICDNYKGASKILNDTKPLFNVVKADDIDQSKEYNEIEDRYKNFLESEFFKMHFGINKMELKSDNQKAILLEGQPMQQIFFGAPGTGKSHGIKEATAGKSVIRTTFHPDSDYSTFVGAYKPVMEDVEVRVVPVVLNNGAIFDQNKGTLKEKRISYKYIKQAFLKAYLEAWKKYTLATNTKIGRIEPQYLIIEEINRGNCAQIFGDLFQLLDRNSANNFSTYPIDADTDLQNEIESAFKEGQYKLNYDIEIEGVVEDYISNNGSTLSNDVQEGRVLLLPPNLYIWATMNTSDQSLFPIDSAFKRRWDWNYVPIADAGLKWKINVDGKHYDWWEFLSKINEAIGEATQSEDKKLGYFFCQAIDGEILAKTFVSKVIFYLWNDVFKDFGLDSALFKDEDGKELSFSRFYVNDKQSGAKVDEKKVSIFLKNLNVAPKDIDEGDESTSSKTKHIFWVNNNGPIETINQVVYETIKEYVKLNPTKTVQDVINTWGGYAKYSIRKWIVVDKQADYSVEVKCADGSVWVNKDGWMFQPSNKALKDSLSQFISAVNGDITLGITIKVEPEEETDENSN